MRALIAAGGTGGHLYPALALAFYLKEHNLAEKILWIGGKRGVEVEVVPASGFEFKKISVRRCPRNIRGDWIGFVYGLILSFFQSFLILLHFKPHVVVGMGSFHSYPVVSVAFFLGIPSLICEQNVRPSLTNRLLLRWASKIAISFPQTKRYIPPRMRKKACLVGNPIRPEILKMSREMGRRKLGLDNDRFTLLFLGGSQGAHSLNLAGMEAIGLLEREGVESEVQVIFITGEKDLEMVKGYLNSSRMRVAIFPYLNHMEYAYAASDLVISRSGATTLAEITARGLPSILIPYPYATLRHQWENAKVLEERKAACTISEKDLSGETLKEMILKLMKDKKRLEEMGKRSKELARPEATSKMAKLVCELAKRRKIC